MPWTFLPAAAVAPAIILAVFGVLMALELWRPVGDAPRSRWPVNLGLALVNLLLTRLLSIAGPIAAAAWAEVHGVGLFHWLSLDSALAIPLGIILLDGAIYWQHRAMHVFAWGWALHRLHHADGAMDVSTGVRFHPGEALLSMLYKALLALLLGLPVAVIALFELWIAVFSLFEHSNFRLPDRADRLIRAVWVTPAMHRIHHSAHGEDHNHNYGFAIGLWDHLFATYRAMPSGPNIGLPLRPAAG